MTIIYEHNLLIFGDEGDGKEIISLLVHEMNLLASETNDLSMKFIEHLPSPKGLNELDITMNNWHKENHQPKIEDFHIIELGTSEEYCSISFMSANEHYAKLINQISKLYKNSTFSMNIYLKNPTEIEFISETYKNGEKVTEKQEDTSHQENSNRFKDIEDFIDSFYL